MKSSTNCHLSQEQAQYLRRLALALGITQPHASERLGSLSGLLAALSRAAELAGQETEDTLRSLFERARS